MFFNAAIELEWHLTILVLSPFKLLTAHFTILCETVFVNNTRRSGEPILSFIEPLICVKILERQLYCLLNDLYLHTIQSLPPIITILNFSPFWLDLTNHNIFSDINSTSFYPANAIKTHFAR